MSENQDDSKPPVITALVLRPGMPEENKRPEHETAPLPARFSDALVRAIVARVTKMVPVTVACAAEGLSGREFAAWRRLYEEGKAHPKVVEFFELLERGEAVAEADVVEDLASSTTSADLKFKVLQARWANRWSQAERKVLDAEMKYLFNKLEAANPPWLAEFLDIAASLTDGNK